MDKIRFNCRHLITDTKTNESQMQNISQQLNWLSTYLYFDIKMTTLCGVHHEIYDHLSWRPPSLKMADVNVGEGQK